MKDMVRDAATRLLFCFIILLAISPVTYFHTFYRFRQRGN